MVTADLGEERAAGSELALGLACMSVSLPVMLFGDVVKENPTRDGTVTKGLVVLELGAVSCEAEPLPFDTAGSLSWRKGATFPTGGESHVLASSNRGDPFVPLRSSSIEEKRRRETSSATWGLLV